MLPYSFYEFLVNSNKLVISVLLEYITIIFFCFLYWFLSLLWTKILLPFRWLCIYWCLFGSLLIHMLSVLSLFCATFISHDSLLFPIENPLWFSYHTIVRCKHYYIQHLWRSQSIESSELSASPVQHGTFGTWWETHGGPPQKTREKTIERPK